MTEAEWLACEELCDMIVALHEYRPFRKFRHLVHAAFGTVAGPLRGAQFTRFFELVGRLTDDGDVGEQEVDAAHDLLMYMELTGRDNGALIAALRSALYDQDAELPTDGRMPKPVGGAFSTIDELTGFNSEDGSPYVALVRDIFGNPFRPATFSTEWRTNTVMSLARQMYESREFSAMPILADALQDAGCDSEAILNHCRDVNATHVRGCWVVDLVLGKE